MSTAAHDLARDIREAGYTKEQAVDVILHRLSLPAWMRKYADAIYDDLMKLKVSTGPYRVVPGENGNFWIDRQELDCASKDPIFAGNDPEIAANWCRKLNEAHEVANEALKAEVADLRSMAEDREVRLTEIKALKDQVEGLQAALIGLSRRAPNHADGPCWCWSNDGHGQWCQQAREMMKGGGR